MGIPGILKEIGKGDRTALAKLAIEHLERHNRPLRIAIDAAIWNFQTQSGQGGKNPALRTLFFRLLRLLALPIQPVFVYDGKNKPLTKRGRTVNRYTGTCVPNELSKVLVRKFCYPWHVAPGEAEAECALLQKKGVVDVVMSQDVDAIMFGARITLRDWSKEGTRGNKSPTHVNVIDSARLKEISRLDPNGMILVALLSGGDYDEAGIPGFGSTLACEIARAGFADDMIDLVQKQDWSGLREWRERLQYELETNESGYFKRKHKTLIIPDTFPDQKILSYYTTPAISKDNELPGYETEWEKVWNSEIDVPALREYTVSMFDWAWRSGAKRFVRCFAQPHFQNRLLRGVVSTQAFTLDNITERRQHFINDGIPELRFSAIPANMVDLDIEAEENNPEWAVEQADEEDDILTMGESTAALDEATVSEMPVSPSKKRKSPPWDPYAQEKWWIPETLLQLGLPAVVEDWHQLQRDIRADPKRFATRKAPRPAKSTKHIDSNMKSGAIRGFFQHVGKQTTSIDSGGESRSLFMADTPESEKLNERISSERITNFHTTNTATQTCEKVSSEKLASTPTPEPKGKSSGGRVGPRLTDKHDDIPKGSILNDLSIGSSFSEAITIESSPAPSPVQHTNEHLLTHEELNHITQRRPRRTKTGQNIMSSSPPTSPRRERRPIESFFMHNKTTTPFSDGGDTPLTMSEVSTHIALPSMSSTGLSTGLKSTASARESLPGAWKEIDVLEAPIKRGPRISYIDLCND